MIHQRKKMIHQPFGVSFFGYKIVLVYDFLLTRVFFLGKELPVSKEFLLIRVANGYKILLGKNMLAQQSLVSRVFSNDILESKAWSVVEYSADNKKRFYGIQRRLLKTTGAEKLSVSTKKGILNDIRGNGTFKEAFSLASTSINRGVVLMIHPDLPTKHIVVFDFDDVTLDELQADGYSIPFPILPESVYVETSNRGGVHVFCEVSPEIYPVFKTVYSATAKQIKYKHGHIDLLSEKHLITVTGKEVADYSSWLHTDYVSYIAKECCKKSTEFNLLATNKTAVLSLSKTANFSGYSEYFFRAAKLIYQLVKPFDSCSSINLPDLWFTILSKTALYKYACQDTHWKTENKLRRLCDKEFLEDVKQAVDNPESKNGVLKGENNLVTDITPEVLPPTAVSLETQISSVEVDEKVKFNQIVFATEYLKKGIVKDYIKTPYSWYKYADNMYQSLTSKEVETEILNHISALLVSITTSVSTLKAITDHIMRRVPYSVPTPAGRYIPLKDGLLDIDTLNLVSPSKEIFNTYTLPLTSDVVLHTLHNFDSLYEKSNLKTFFDSSFNGEMDKLKMMQAYIGSVLSVRSFSDIQLSQKFLYVYGQAGSGKGVLANLLLSVFPTSCGMSLPTLDTRFGAAVLIDKPLCIFNDVQKNMKQFKVAWEVILQATGGGRVTIEKKGLDGKQFELLTKFMFFSNFPLNTPNTEAINRRALFIEFKQAFDGVEGLAKDYYSLLATKEERALFLVWCLKGVDIFKKEGIKETEASNAVKTDATETDDCITSFIHECLVKDTSDGAWESYDAIDDAFDRFYVSLGVSRFDVKPTKTSVHKAIVSYIGKYWFKCAVDKLKVTKKVLGKTHRGVAGVRIKGDEGLVEDLLGDKEW